MSRTPPVVPPSAVYLVALQIHNIDVAGVLNYMEDVIAKGRRGFVAYANVHGLNLAVELSDFRRILNAADIVFCDGHGLRIGAWLAGVPLSYRFTPPDWIDRLCEMCAAQGHSLYFLGGRPGIAEEAAERLRCKHTGLRIVGTHHGYFDTGHDSPGSQLVLDDIRRKAPTILLVGLGMPIQERWISRNYGCINANVTMTVGAMFDYVAGVTYRAPRWVTDNGLEWLARLFVEPGRLWRRYVLGNPKFVWRVVRWRLRAGGRTDSD